MYFEIVKGNNIAGFLVNIYFFSCMIIGKYVIFNLFTAMVLDGFSSDEVKKQIAQIEGDSEPLIIEPMDTEEIIFEDVTKNRVGPLNNNLG